jgi:predicted enzyme related to lactoylglutathione lyase
MADQSVRGRFVWHELVTPDANAAHAFYGKAIGWKSQPWEEDSSYVMFAAPRGPIGATVARNGITPHWLPYIGTGDVEKTVELAKQKGATVAKEVDTLSSGSRYAVLEDPYGAAFGVYESAENYGKITPPKPGEHSWHELMSSDHHAAFDFYSALFGWEKIGEHDMGDMGTYLIYGLNGKEFGGMMRVMDGGPPAAWVSYVHVKDVNQTAKKVKSAGGQVIKAPMEVPGGDWIVLAVDPQGAMFAAHASAASMKKPEKKPKQPKPEQLTLAAESPPPVVQDPETPANEEAPPADKPPEAPAKKAPARKAPAKKAPPAPEAPAEEAPVKQAPARKSPAKKAPAKKAPTKKAPAKKPSKGPAKKSGKKKSSKKPAAKGAGSKKTAAKKGAKKGASKKAAAKSKTRSGGKKKAVKKPRKGK